MVEVANEPAVVLICIVFAAGLIVAEFALPTFGLAGTLGFALLVFGAIGIEDAGLDWWPLSLVAVAVAFWCVMIARRDAPIVQQGIAVALFTAGAVYFGVLAEDVTTIVVGLIGAAGLAAVFPVLAERSAKLLGAPSSTGMDAFPGQTAKVSAWAGTEGSVVVEGSFWNAKGPEGLAEGDDIVVTGYEGMTLTVRRPAPDPGGKPVTMPHKDVR
jgi:membrane-bound serine protease (ClpP class)